MKILNLLIAAFFSSFFVTQSFADIRFIFQHNPSLANVNFPWSMAPTLYMSAQKENGAHLAESDSTRNQKGDLYPGEKSDDFVKSSLFAPDPAGTYIININCYLRLAKGKKEINSFSTKIPNLKNGSTVTLEAECPLTKDDNNLYHINPPKNIIIVDGKYIMGAPAQGELHK